MTSKFDDAMQPPQRPDEQPIQLAAPDISRYRAGNTGIDYVTRFDSGRPGPAVTVQALTHGNEICGAIALDWLLREEFRPSAGSLTVVFANIAAYSRWDPVDPHSSRFVEEDFNRIWGDDALQGPRDSIELRRARELRPVIDATDLLLDIHSMHEPCAPIMVCGATGNGGEKAAAYARRLGVPENLLVDTGHAAGLRMIERGPFGDPLDERTAILIECGQHWEAAAADVAIDTTLRFLELTGVAAPDFVRPRLRMALPARQRLITVTEAVVAKSTSFRFAAYYRGMEIIPTAGTPIGYDGDEVIRTPYDNTVLVMPSVAHLKPGTTVVRLGQLS